jgi:hypothetical protein
MQKTFTAYLILMVILILGLVLIYRSLLTTSDWIMIQSKVYRQKIETSSSAKGGIRYALVFDIDKEPNRIGIFLGTSGKSDNNKIFDLVDTAKLYKFYLDPTVIADNGIQLGVRKIEYDGKTIYKESNTFNILGGAILTLLGAVGLFIIYRFKRKQNAS